MLMAMGWTKKESIYGRLVRAFKYRFSVFFFFFNTRGGKKNTKIHVMLVENWKHIFETTYQTAIFYGFTRKPF